MFCGRLRTKGGPQRSVRVASRCAPVIRSSPQGATIVTHPRTRSSGARASSQSGHRHRRRRLVPTAGRHVGHGRIAEKDHAQPPARTAEQAGPVTLNLAVHQDVKTEPVAVETQARVEVANYHDRVVNRAWHSRTLATDASRRPRPLGHGGMTWAQSDSSLAEPRSRRSRCLTVARQTLPIRHLRNRSARRPPRRRERPGCGPALPRLRESSRCLRAARSAAACKRTSLSLPWPSSHRAPTAGLLLQRRMAVACAATVGARVHR